MNQNILGESYEDLLGFRIMIEANFLKWEGQCLKSTYEITILVMYLALLTNVLKWLQKI